MKDLKFKGVIATRRRNRKYKHRANKHRRCVECEKPIDPKCNAKRIVCSDECYRKRMRRQSNNWYRTKHGRELVLRSGLLLRCKRNPDYHFSKYLRYLWLGKTMGWDKIVKKAEHSKIK